MPRKNTERNGISFVQALQLVFINLKLVGVIDWSWWWVLAPIWICVCIAILVVTLSFFIRGRKQ